jgi:hypothetical protein
MSSDVACLSSRLFRTQFVVLAPCATVPQVTPQTAIKTPSCARCTLEPSLPAVTGFLDAAAR